MGDFLFGSLKERLSGAIAISFALDDSVDLTDTEQMAIWVRFVDSGLNVCEELLGMSGMRGQTRGRDLYKAFCGVMDKFSIDKAKIVAVSTDGAPSMTGSRQGLVAFVKNEISSHIITFHCVIHQEALCANSSAMLPEVMASVVKIVNTIMANELSHRKFKV